MATTEDYYYDDPGENSTGDYPAVDGTYAAPCVRDGTWRFARGFAPPAYGLVFALALLGNALVLAVLWRYRLARRGPCAFSLTDTFLLHLALADLLLGLTLPLYAAQWAREWTFGRAACKLAGAAFSLNLHSGVLFLACISFDRYLAIVHAARPGWRRRPAHAQLACAGIWAACLGLSLVDVCYREVVPAPSFGGRLCLRAFHPDSSDRWRLALQALDVALGFAAPLLVMLYCYAQIFRSLCLASRRQRQRSLRLIVSVVAAFLLTWAPYNAFLLADSLLRLELLPASCQLEAVLDVGTLAAESLGLAHCAVNPLLYAFVGVKFRRELGRMCRGALGGRGAGGRRWGHRGRGGHKSRRVTGSMTSDSETSSTYYSVVM
ncbi:C-X-C chemokine receptor type 3-2 [Lepisosteus oculatus]|uniref:C-X-C chemokine receptor type 3-2 n=1 Tax=Lepisosteus oculatus TaxID=7918 RepID=UPI00371DAAB9